MALTIITVLEGTVVNFAVPFEKQNTNIATNLADPRSGGHEHSALA